MRGEIFLLNQMINSMSDAVIRLEAAKNQSKADEFNKLKLFILDIQKKIDEEISKGFV